MTDITQVSDDALKQEVDRRKGTSAAVELRIEIMEHHKWVLANVDVLLEMAPKHDRLGCSDDSLNKDQGHGYKQIPRCKRCALLDIKKRNTNYYISVDLMVRFENED